MQQFLAAVDAGEIPEEAFADTLEGLEGLLADMPGNRQENNISRNNISKNNRERVRESRPKSVEAVRAYCQERNNGVDPEKFWDYYETNGWKQGGRAPIKDWKACVRTWERKDGRGPRPKGGTQNNGTMFADSFV